MELPKLTAKERSDIRQLVYQCANYNRQERICLLADCMCITLDCMQDITRTATMCKYFKRAVLPLNPELEARLTGQTPLAKKLCPLCNKEFLPKTNRQRHCSEKCSKKAKSNYSREWMKKHRENGGSNVDF